ncbi:MAG: hypothetical protein AAGF06_05065 [Pseudomonadota bacterium]
MSPEKMRVFLFAVVSLCILGGVFLSVLAIWGYLGRDAAWKSIATLGVISVGCFAFNMANDQFVASDDDD